MVLFLFICSVMRNCLQPRELQHARLPCSSRSLRVCSDLYPLSQWCNPTISSLSPPFPLAFNLSQYQDLFQWVSASHQMGQTIGASPLVLTVNIQGWFPLRLTSLISLLSNGLSRAFSSTKFQSINSLVFCLLHCPALISVHDYWKDPCLGYMDLCWKSDTFAFPLIV